MGSSTSIPELNTLEDKSAQNTWLYQQLHQKYVNISTLEATINRLENELEYKASEINIILEELEAKNHRIYQLEEDLYAKDCEIKNAKVKIGQLGKLISSQNENIRKLKKLNSSKEKQQQQQAKKATKKINPQTPSQPQNVTINQSSSSTENLHGASTILQSNYNLIVFNMDESDHHYMDILQVENFMRQMTGKSIKCMGLCRLGELRSKPRPIKVQIPTGDMETLLKCKDKTKNMNCYPNVTIDQYRPPGEKNRKQRKHKNRFERFMLAK